MKTAAFLAILVLLPLQARADTACPQEKAVYQGDDGFSAAFVPVGSDAAMISHRFNLSRETIALTGYIMDSDAPVRSIAHVEKDCPEGDVTGEDIAACTVYEGYVYALGSKGGAAKVPGAGEPAAPHLLLAGLGPSIAASPLAQKLTLAAPAGDLFTFKECAP